MAMAGGITDVRRCGAHPEVAAVDTCRRCGAFVCGECLELLGDEAFCAACYQRPDVTGKASTRATIALLCSASGLLLGGCVGGVGLALAYLEGRAIERGEAPLTSRSHVKVAKILGWVSIALTLAAPFVFFAVGYLSRRFVFKTE